MNQLISIIIPVFNVADYLDRCLNTVTSQTYKNLEIILIDDGSTDDSGKICDIWGEKDNRIKVFHTVNKGVAAARNYAISIAKGDYIGFVDPDDYVNVDMFEILLNAADRFAADIVICGFEEVKSEVRRTKQVPYTRYYARDEALHELIKDEDIQSYVWNKLFKQQCVPKNPFLEIKQISDLAGMHKFFQRADVIVHINRSCYHYCRRDVSLVSKPGSIEPSVFHCLAMQFRYDDLYIENEKIRVFAAEKYIKWIETNIKKKILETLHGCDDTNAELIKSRIAPFYSAHVKDFRDFVKGFTPEKEKELFLFLNDPVAYSNPDEYASLYKDRAPAISVIIPVYNAEKYLAQAIESVLQQDIKDLEIICVDDGSTDGSKDILQAYSQKYNNITVLTQANLFAGVARNNGLLAAQGEYIAFLDADDWLLPHALKELYAVAKTQDLDMIKGNFFNYNNENGKIFTTNYSINFGVKEEYRNRILTFYDCPNQALSIADSPCNGLYKRSFLIYNNINFCNLKCSNDRSFFIECLLKAKRMMVVETFIFYYRVAQKHSLIGIRGQHFSDQLATYNLVKNLSKHLPENLSRILMQKELKQVLHWYRKLNDSVTDQKVKNKMKEQMQIFFSYYEKCDVTPSFLRKNLNDPVISFLNESVLPEITVIIPVYNAGNFVRNALDSLKKQTFADYEVICVNDGSTDYSLEILKEYAKEDYRIRVINNTKNLRAGVSRNIAMKVARGKYITFLDADDALTKDALEQFYIKGLETDADCIICQSFDSKGIHEFSLHSQYLPTAECFSAADIPDFIFNFTTGGPGGKCVKRSLIAENKIEYSKLARSEDIIFVYKTLIKSKKIAVIKKPLYQIDVILNEKSLEHTKHETPLIFWEAITEIKSMLKEEGALEKFSRSIINAHVNRCLYNINRLKHSSGYNILKVKKLFSETGIDRKIIKELELYDHEKDYFFVPAYSELLDFLEKTYEEYLQDYADYATEHEEKLRSAQRQLKELHASFSTLKKYITGRIDIKNYGGNNNAVLVIANSDDSAQIQKPDWFKNEQGTGLVFHSTKGIMETTIQCIGNGELKICLRGKDCRNKDNIRVPVWINYKSLFINGVCVFKEPKLVCHDNPFIYKLNVADGQIIKIFTEWQYAQDEQAQAEMKQLAEAKTGAENKLKQAQAEIKHLTEAKTGTENKLHDARKRVAQLEKDKLNTSEKLSKEQRKVAQLNNELKNVKNGWSFKIGRVITWAPRKIRGLLK